MSTKKIMIVVILVVAAGVAIYGWQEYNRKNEDLSGAKAKYSVEATQLISEFNQNDSAANARYLGQVVAVNGMVKGMEKDEEGRFTLVLGDTTDMSSVRCALDSTHAADATTLRRGESVKVRGAFTGFKKDDTGLLGSDVELNRAVVIKNK
jgi:tRNA_anti-like